MEYNIIRMEMEEVAVVRLISENGDDDMGKYVKVNFGNNTRTYLYKLGKHSVEEGMMILVPAKNKFKIGMAVWIGKIEDDDLPVSLNTILEIKSHTEHTLTVKDLKNYFQVLVSYYKEGDMSKEQLVIVFEGIIKYNKLDFEGNNDLEELYCQELPYICTRYVHEQGEDAEKELEFWKHIREWSHKIKFGYCYKERHTQKWCPVIKESEVEDTDEYIRVELEVERRIIDEIGQGGYMGYCHLYWYTKKRILKEYGIDWQSPQELNPRVIFD